MQFAVNIAIVLLVYFLDQWVVLEGFSFDVIPTNKFLNVRRGELAMRERKCDLSGSRKNSKCMHVSKSNVHTHRVQNVNLHWRKMWWPEGKKMVRMRLSARSIKTIAKYGLHAAAKKYGVDLNKYSISFGGPMHNQTIPMSLKSQLPRWVTLLHPAKQQSYLSALIQASRVSVEDNEPTDSLTDQVLSSP